MLKFTKYGLRELIICLFFSLTLAIFCILWFPYLLPLPVLFALFAFSFFRDPERKTDVSSKGIVAPADGKIVEIKEISSEDEPNRTIMKISIFMSLFNVHVNRIPYDGEVVDIKYTKGRFLNAQNPDSSLRNEHNTIILRCESSSSFRMKIKQIAGIAARRIVCDLKPGDKVKKGERFGMIKLGSRLEVFLPKDIIDKIEVKIGQKTKGGITVLCTLI